MSSGKLYFVVQYTWQKISILILLFYCGPFLKSLLNLLQYCFCFMFQFFGHKACGILAPSPGIEPTSPALKSEVLTSGPPGKSLISFKMYSWWREGGGGGSGWGTHVNPWLIHVSVWQNPLQYCKVISLQLIKINEKKCFLKMYIWGVLRLVILLWNHYHHL